MTKEALSRLNQTTDIVGIFEFVALGFAFKAASLFHGRRMNTIWRVSQYLFRYKKLFALMQFMAIGMTASSIAIPHFIQLILEKIEQTGTTEQLVQGVIWIVLLYLGSEIFNGFRILINNVLEQKVLLDMRADLHSKLLRLPVSFYDRQKSGEISSRVIDDVNNVERALLDGSEIGGRAVIMILGVTITLFVKNPFLAAFVCLPVPILLVAGYYYSKGSRKVWKRVREATGDLNSLLVEDIQGNRLIQTFALQDRESRRFLEKANLLKTRALRAMYRWSIYNPLTTFLTNLGVASVIGVGGYLIIQGNSDFSFSSLVAFVIYANMLYQPIGQLHSINHLIAAGKSSGDRVFEILDEPILVKNPEHPKTFPEGVLNIQFENVSFQYPERAPVLKEFSLELKPGEVTALVGHTGAGKSTVANLAMRTYDVTEGQITINGVDIRSLNLEDVHNHIGHVAQDPFLFEGSVRENMILAKPDATESEIIAALKGASAWEFVEKLPDQLETNIGEKGIRLSQGEKQRLTIARVLLKNPPIVILDEATASVDTITERHIQNSLDHLMRNRTVLIIAHRLSTVRKANNIVVLGNGEILESGTHSELLIRNGNYAHLWNHQVDLIDETKQ